MPSLSSNLNFTFTAEKQFSGSLCIGPGSWSLEYVSGVISRAGRSISDVDIFLYPQQIIFFIESGTRHIESAYHHQRRVPDPWQRYPSRSIPRGKLMFRQKAFTLVLVAACSSTMLYAAPLGNIFHKDKSTATASNSSATVNVDFNNTAQ